MKPLIGTFFLEILYTVYYFSALREKCYALCNSTSATRSRPSCETDRGTASAARLLLLVLGMCAHSVEAQSTLVTEVKSALARTVALPEAHASKHARIQAIAALVCHLAEVANPAASQDPNRSTRCAVFAYRDVHRRSVDPDTSKAFGVSI